MRADTSRQPRDSPNRGWVTGSWELKLGWGGRGGDGKLLTHLWQSKGNWMTGCD